MNPLNIQLDLGGAWLTGEFIFTSLTALVVANYAKEHIGSWAAALLGYILFSALYILEYPAMLYGPNHIAFQSYAGRVIAEIILIPIAAWFAPRWIWKVVSFFILIELGMVWRGDGRGFMGWSSFSLSTIALCVPFIPKWMWVPIIATIAVKHATTAKIILVSQLFALAIKNKQYRKWLLLAIPAALGLARLKQLNSYLDSGERLMVYKKFLTIWWKNGWLVKLLGFGPGSFLGISLISSKSDDALFLQLHNDWLQCLFENGLIGLSLLLGTVVSATTRIWANPKLLAGLTGVCVCAIAYYPFRWAESAFICALIFKETLEIKKAVPLSKETAYVTPMCDLILSNKRN